MSRSHGFDYAQFFSVWHESDKQYTEPDVAPPEQVVRVRCSEEHGTHDTYYHEACYLGQFNLMTNVAVEYMPFSSIGRNVTCSGCWQFLRREDIPENLWGYRP
jgi:hypothetical protein